MRIEDAESRWSQEEFGHAKLGDSRRVARLMQMGARLARSPAGRVTEVFDSPRELQGGYDFLEESPAMAVSITDASAVATVRRLRSELQVVIAVDGSSLQVVDHGGQKGLGRLGPYAAQGRGVKMISALAMRADGGTEGLADQQLWHREDDPSRSVARGAIKKKRNRRTPTEQKETQHWIDTIVASERRFTEHAPNVRRVYVIDREADSRALLDALAATKQGFVVRASWDRRIEVNQRAGLGYLRDNLRAQPVLGYRDIHVPGAFQRKARMAHMQLRTTEVTLLMRDGHGRKSAIRARVRVVQALEIGTTPSGEKPLDWTLLTNLDVESTVEGACAVLDRYQLRWRIEEFHKTLKSGGCNAESMQLRTRQAVNKWTTLLSAVAARIERLKHLSRVSPDLPATVALSELEIRALILLKRQIKKRTEIISDAMPTIGQATLWIAELGSYTGKSSGGPPGSITISRGFERVRTGASLLAALQSSGSDQ